MPSLTLPLLRAYMPPCGFYFHSENLHSPIRPSDPRSRGGVKIEISESNRSTAPRPLPFSDLRIPMSLLDFCTKPSSYTTGPGVSVVRKSWLGGQVHSLRSPFSDLQSISRPAPGRSAVREARERKVAGASFPARINASPAGRWRDIWASFLRCPINEARMPAFHFRKR